MIVFTHFFSVMPEKITLYLCIHDVRLLFLLSSSFNKARGGERIGGRKNIFGILHVCCLIG